MLVANCIGQQEALTSIFSLTSYSPAPDLIGVGAGWIRATLPFWCLSPTFTPQSQCRGCHEHHSFTMINQQTVQILKQRVTP